MAPRLQGKVALVTGSTRGIGRAIAMTFAAEGAAVIVTGRNRDQGRAVETAIQDAGGSALYIPADLAKDADVEALVAGAVRRYGKLSVLVNNAAPTDLVGPGRRSDGPVTEITLDGWDRVMDVALKGMVRCCKHCIPEMAKAGGGAIINISSAAGVLGVPGIDAYTAAKAAMVGLTRSIAVEYGPAGVRSNCIVVGFIPTSKWARDQIDDPVLGASIRSIHLTRLGTPEDVANAAAFLASDEAGFITGAVLPVEGGVTCKLVRATGAPALFTPEKK